MDTATGTRYARTPAGATLAYQVLGEGPDDLLFNVGNISHLEVMREEPGVERMLGRLAEFSRLILFDRRGSGLSDPLPEGQFDLDDEVDDIFAVLEASGSERPALLGYTTTGPLFVRLARRYPERVKALILYSSFARTTAAPGYDWTYTVEEREAALKNLSANWGSGANLEALAPSRCGDERLRSWMGRLERAAMSPGAHERLWRRAVAVDVREDLAHLRVPTLVLHRKDDQFIDPRHSRYLAERIPGAKYVELPGVDSLLSVGDTEAVLGEVEEFITGGRRGATAHRRLLTVLFTDIVDATDRAAQLGDGAWRDLLTAHDAAVRRELERFDGREVKTIGDAFLATFIAPSHGLRCARALVEAVHDLGLEVRVGIHTGECEIMGEDVGGMAVHIAARVAALARPGEVLASGTAFGTVVGSGLEFEWRANEQLKGVPGMWPLFTLVAS